MPAFSGGRSNDDRSNASLKLLQDSILSRNHLTCAVQPDYGSSLSLQQLPMSPRIEQIAPLFDPGRKFFQN